MRSKNTLPGRKSAAVSPTYVTSVRTDFFDDLCIGGGSANRNSVSIAILART
jgi:hypothetical protein